MKDQTDNLESANARADTARMTGLLYLRAIRYLESARKAWAAEPFAPPAVQAALQAQHIVHELQFSLNYNNNTELAVSLGELYEYMEFVLMQLTTRRSAMELECLDEVLQLLTALHGAWSEAADQSAQYARKVRVA